MKVDLQGAERKGIRKEEKIVQLEKNLATFKERVIHYCMI